MDAPRWLTADEERAWQEIRRGNVRLVLDILEEGRRAGLWNVPDPEVPVLILLGGLRAVLRFTAPPRSADLVRRIIDDFLHGASRAEPAPQRNGTRRH